MIKKLADSRKSVCWRKKLPVCPKEGTPFDRAIFLQEEGHSAGEGKKNGKGFPSAGE